LADAVQGSAQHLQGFSKAQLGDKTMLDALFPFVDTLVGQVDAGASISDAWRSAADACREAAEATAPLVPKIGRARPLAERSVGTPDPGAISLGLIVTAIGDVLGEAQAATPQATESMDKEGQPT
jgi:D-erythrulose 4-kinase